jgi:hypothetical protein
MGTTAKAGGTEFPKAPAGTHIARCYQVIDLGHQKIVFQGQEQWKHKVLLSWELCNELMTEGESTGKPFSISNRYTLSLSDKSILGPMLEAWRGKPFSPSEREGFDIKNVLGAYCMLNVVHNTEGDKTYANVSAVMALPKGSEKPAPANKNIYFDLDNDDINVLPEWIQNIIKKSREFTEGDERESVTQGRGNFEDLKDDIPF